MTLVRNLYTFYFRVRKNENSQWFSDRIHLHGWRVSQLQRCSKCYGAEIEMWIRSWRFLLDMTNHFFFTKRISANNSNSIFIHFVGWFFHALQTLANQWLPSYHINVLSSNILSRCSFFSQHWPLETLWGWLHYIPTL